MRRLTMLLSFLFAFSAFSAFASSTEDQSRLQKFSKKIWDKRESRFFKKFDKKFSNVQEAVNESLQHNDFPLEELAPMLQNELEYLRQSGQKEAADIVEAKLEKDGIIAAYYVFQSEPMRAIMKNNLREQIRVAGSYKAYRKSLGVRKCRTHKGLAIAAVAPVVGALFYTGGYVLTALQTGAAFVSAKVAAWTILSTGANIGISYGPMKWIVSRLATSCYMLPESVMQ